MGKRELTVKALCMKKLILHEKAVHRQSLKQVCQRETAAIVLPRYSVWDAEGWQEFCNEVSDNRKQYRGPHKDTLAMTMRHKALVRTHKHKFWPSNKVEHRHRMKRTPFTKERSRTV